MTRAPDGTFRPRTASNSIDPCTARFLRAAVEATAEHGLEGLTIDAVCARAGEARAEFEQRWSDPIDLLRDALDERMRLPQLPDTGTLADDLVEFAQAYFERCADQSFTGCVMYVLAHVQSDAQLAARLLPDFIHRRASSRILIDRAVARGELPPDTEPDAILDGLLERGLSWMAVGTTPSRSDFKAAVEDLLAREAWRRGGGLAR